MEKYDFENLCLNCLGTLGSDRVCSACGKRADEVQNQPHQLQKYTLLNKKYLIGKALGEGGFGITYLAWDLYKKEKVAIKEYFPGGHVSRDESSGAVNINSKQQQSHANRGLKRFIDEAQILSKIKSLDGIVEVRDFFSANNTAYIVMEFLDGISLKRYIQRKGKLSMDTALTILHPVVASLKEVHSLGLLHRDISPDNILITKKNEVKLIDFGAAKRFGDEETNMAVVLKQGFAPEEQYRSNGVQGEYTDVYALGVTIYYCITGQLPPESVERVKKDAIVLPSSYGAVISHSQQQLLMKAIAVKAEDRFQTMTEMESELYKSFTKTRSTAPLKSRTDNTKSFTRPSMRLDSDKIYDPTADITISEAGRSAPDSAPLKNARISVRIDQQPIVELKPKNAFKRWWDNTFNK